MSHLSVSEAALVLKPAAVRYLRAVVYGTPRQSDHTHVVAAEATDGVGELLARSDVPGGGLTPRARAILAHLDGNDGELAEGVLDAWDSVRRVQTAVYADVRTWGDVDWVTEPTLTSEGVVLRWDVRFAGRRERTLEVTVGRTGRVHCDLRTYVWGREPRLCPMVMCSSGASVAEALEALGSPGQGL